jgi:hypothetical protein
MNAPLRPEVLLRPEPPPQQELALATAGVLRYVWHHRFGQMLIEVDGEQVFVNGQPVQPALPSPSPSIAQPGPAASSTRSASS